MQRDVNMWKGWGGNKNKPNCDSLFQSISQAAMADVTPPDSSILNEESDVQPGPPQENHQDDEPTAESINEGEEREGRSSSNFYPYIKEDLFTSEIFKVKIQNLPKNISFNDLKRFLNKQWLNPHKIKLMGKQNFAFVTFKNQVGYVYHSLQFRL